MKRCLPVSFIIIFFTITLCCNYTYAQLYGINALDVSSTSLSSDPDYNAFDPVLLISKNPTTCNGSEGSIVFGGLTPNTAYQVSYNHDGVTIGPVTIVTDGAGELTLAGLNKGEYSNFVFNAPSGNTQLLNGTDLSDPKIIPLFGSFADICAGNPAPVLPSTSINGLPGTWSPAVVDNQNSGTYTFTPAPGTCGKTVTVNILVTPRTVPTFPFGTSLLFCTGGTGTVPLLPNTSTNGITGTWSPAVVDPNNSGTYVFTATSPGCVTGTTFTVTVNPTITPTFSFSLTASICEGDAVITLPNTSLNGITGTWSPAVVSNTASGTYTFTADPGQCATPVTYTVTVTPKTTPTFSFGTSLTICSGGTVPVLPNTSDNGITGTWSPAVVSNTTSGTYTFTPSSNPCSPPVTFTVTINPIITPSFTFGATAIVCAGDPVVTLPNTSVNGITGTWNPAVVSNTASGTYTFTPDAGQCATPATYTVTVYPKTTPTFSFGPTLTICSGETVPVLPTTSNNGLGGIWAPAVVSNTASGTYTFTSSTNPCAPSVTFTVTVNPVVTPAFSFGSTQSVCINDPAPVLPAVSVNGITGAWSPAVVDNQNSGTYTFTPDAGQCAVTTTFTYQVNPIPSITNSIEKDTSVYDGTVLPPYNFTVNDPAGDIKWTNSNAAVGLGASGTGTIPSFKAVNTTYLPVTATVTATPFINGCSGTTSQSFKITVLPLAKEVFVPNVFSPNGDGKNDQLFIYSNYIVTVEMHIFNQWGEHIATLNSTNQGWDGKYKGTSQPVGVYVYVLKALLKDGKNINMKGSITLIR